MLKISIFSFVPAAALFLGVSLPAAAINVIVTPGMFSPNPDASTTTFDSGILPANFTASGPATGVVSGSVVNQYRAPEGDTTPYAYIGANSFITASFTSSPISSFGLYWGSIDSYNGISFTDTNGNVSTYGFGGTPIAGLPVDTATSAYVTFETSGAAWTSVQLTSGAPAFEFDNVAVTTPEPASLALLGGGLLAIGAGAIRRRRSSK